MLRTVLAFFGFPGSVFRQIAPPQTIAASPPGAPWATPDGVEPEPPARKAALKQDAALRPPVPQRNRQDAQRSGSPLIQPNHRQRLLSMKLEHLNFCGRARCRTLAEHGILTAGDLVFATPDALRVAVGSGPRARRWIKMHRRAIRLAVGVPGLMPRDALLLVRVHRNSLNGLARESAGGLCRDFQRFAETTAGRRWLAGRRLPSVRKTRTWIESAKTVVGGNRAATKVRPRATQSESSLSRSGLSRSGLSRSGLSVGVAMTF
ncbi:DUF4332 domain-containing protein [Stieleria varia]|uniref:DUF4332 domain-containing protein n=1 Tax=Stieleria varia TaxID=2528005 RepID=A0A5C6A1V6_9BACT|nr:DUF4332 domain-containing protein [Stieleria varia]TWT93320.1 hypothetical protein Pla52n_59800 [Stieleria varia]